MMICFLLQQKCNTADTGRRYGALSTGMLSPSRNTGRDLELLNVSMVKTLTEKAEKKSNNINNNNQKPKTPEK